MLILSKFPSPFNLRSQVKILLQCQKGGDYSIVNKGTISNLLMRYFSTLLPIIKSVALESIKESALYFWTRAAPQLNKNVNTWTRQRVL